MRRRAGSSTPSPALTFASAWPSVACGGTDTMEYRHARLGRLLPLVAVVALAWVHVLYLAWGMERMDIGADMLLMPRMTDWQLVDLWLVFRMWAVMMVAMMLPSALP